jgi:plasmid stabilization system protein ParE
VKIVIRDSALAELECICSWIEQDSPANASLIAKRIVDAIDNTIAWFPHMGRIGRINGTREWLVRNTPYIIIYRVDERLEVVYVEGVFHGAQDR